MPDRVVELTRHVGLADTRPDASMRLDAIASVLQDAADDDVASANVDGLGMWILRRCALDVHHVPKFRAELRARTWCSGVGAAWAERRTDIDVGATRCIEATALWVHVDPRRATPARLPPAFHDVWKSERTVSGRLQHTAPPAGAGAHAWHVRATDIDVVGHMNNAAYWAPVEEELARRGDARVRHAEIEFRAGIDPEDPVEVVVDDREGGFACWLTVHGDVRASMLVGLGSEPSAREPGTPATSEAGLERPRRAEQQ
jgi:acyl-ACP thioesterase